MFEYTMTVVQYALFALFVFAPITSVVKKAGFNPLLSPLAIVPFVNNILLPIFAYSESPSLREMAEEPA